MGILYKTILHKQRFGQAQCTNLVKRIQIKFTLYFSEISMIYYEFLNLK
jgi:hypothetical protein